MKKSICSHSPNILESHLTIVLIACSDVEHRFTCHVTSMERLENLLATKLDSNPGAISAVCRQVRASEDGIQIDMQRDHY